MEEGVSMSEACANIWLVDSRGLVTDRRDMATLPHHKKPFAHSLEGGGGVSTLEEAVKKLKPSCVIGVSGQPQTFTKSIVGIPGNAGEWFDPKLTRLSLPPPPQVEEMSANHPRPLVFALSNPTSKAECTAEQAYEWSDGQAVFASGSPFPPVQFKGKTYQPAQGNNAYIFPGVGLGAIFCGATRLDSEDMITASKALADLVPQDKIDKGACYPALAEAREVSIQIAAAVACGQWKRGTGEKNRAGEGEETREQLVERIRGSMYEPETVWREGL